MTKSQALAAVLMGATAVGTLGFSVPVFAREAQEGTKPLVAMAVMMPRPIVVGTVASISGSTLSVTTHADKMELSSGSAASVLTLMVDASHATIMKNGATSTLSAIAVGDTVMVRGTRNGSAIIAETINDGKMLGRVFFPSKDLDDRKMKDASSTPKMMGTGEPVIGGRVTVVSNTSLTLMTKSGISYSVSAASTTVMKMGAASSTLSAISVGDAVLVQGAVNGTAVTASLIIDQKSASATKPESADEKHGFFKKLGGFFSRFHLFGFF